MTKPATARRAKRNKAPIAASPQLMAEPVAPSCAALATVELAAKPGKTSRKSAQQAELPVKRPKLIRDSFTLPESDYALFKILKDRCLALGIEVKKSELLRVAMIALAHLSDAQLADAVRALPRIKTGRPAVPAIK